MKFPIPQDWDGTSWCRWSICWPASERWEGFLRGLLTLPQRGWTWDEKTGSILAVQQIGQEITANNLPLEGVIMSCSDATEIVEAINQLREALMATTINVNPTITVSGCGCGSTTTPPIGDPCPPLEPGPGQPGSGTPGAGPGPGEEVPPGLPAAVSARQCKIAQWLIDDYLGSIASNGAAFGLDSKINTIAAVGGEYLGATVLTPIITGLLALIASQIGTPGPTPDDPVWIAIGVAIGALAASHLYSLDFAALGAFASANRDALVCALASSGSAQIGKSNLMAIANASDPALNASNKMFLDKILSTPVMGLLFFVNSKYDALETFVGANFEDDCPCGEAEPETGAPDAAYKCLAANVVLDTLGESTTALGSLGSYSWASFETFLQLITGGGLSTLFQNALVNQPAVAAQSLLAGLSTVSSLVGDLVWIGFDFLNGFPLFQAYFATYRSETLCALVAAADVAEAKTILDDLSGAAVASVLSAHPEWSGGDTKYPLVLGRLYPTALLNLLFAEVEDPEITAYEGDLCDDCGEPEPVDCETEYIWLPGGGGVGNFAGCTVGSELVGLILTVTASNATVGSGGQYFTGFTAGGCAFVATNVVTTGGGGSGIYTDCEGVDHGPSTWSVIEGMPILAISFLNADGPCTIQADVTPADCP